MYTLISVLHTPAGRLCKYSIFFPEMRRDSVLSFKTGKNIETKLQIAT